MKHTHGLMPGSRRILPAALLAAALVLTATSSSLAQPEFSAFPDADQDSGRFTNIVHGLESLGEDEQGGTGVGGTRLMVEVPGDRTQFRLSVFDGDYGGLWDYNPAGSPVVEYLLTPDATGPQGVPDRFPDRDTSGNIIVLERWTSDAPMPDDGWFECTGQNSSPSSSGNALSTGVPTHSAAKVTNSNHPSYGTFRYVFVVRWANSVSGGAMNCFKVRVQGQIFGPAESRFGIMGFQWGFGDYGGSPDWDWNIWGQPPFTFNSPPPTHYDGTWDFFWTLPHERAPYSKLDLWNGDFDVVHDTDDPHSAGTPPWVPAGNTVVQEEEANPGDPADDGILYLASGAWPMPGTMVVVDDDGNPIYEGANRVGILHRIRFPDGSSITELNPSGNMEWENFQVAVEGYYEEHPTETETDLLTGGTRPKRIYPEATVDEIPLGTYTWQIEGADEQNTLFLRPDFDLYAEFGSHALGDRVFWDADGVPSVDDLSEPGINGVKIDLYFKDEAGQWIYYDSTVTGPVPHPGDPTKTLDGYYLFDHIAAGEWKAVVDLAHSPILTVGRAVYDLDGGQDSQATVKLAMGDSRYDLDFSYWKGSAPGTGTPGYWKNHPEAWPVTTLEIGGVTYTRDQAIARMEAATSSKNRVETMFTHLVAGLLNAYSGNDASAVWSTLLAADAWMAEYGATNVKGSSSAWKEGEPLASKLDDYNNGLLPGAPSRDSITTTSGGSGKKKR